MYTAEDFNTENAPKEMVQYIIDNVDDFEPRYQHALFVVGRDRCPLRMADLCLYAEISDMIEEWCSQENWLNDNDYCSDDFDIGDIFG